MLSFGAKRWSLGMAFSPQRLSSSMVTYTPVLPRCAGSNPLWSGKSRTIAPRASSEASRRSGRDIDDGDDGYMGD